MLKVNLRLFDSKKEGPNEKANGKLDVSAIDKKIDEMLEKASKKAEEILAKAEAEAEKRIKDAEKISKKDSLTKEEKVKAKKEFDAYMNEKVAVQLFKDSNKYKDDVTLTVNGETVLIKRGVPVMVKRKFKEVLEASERQGVIAADTMNEFENQYKAKQDRLN